MEYNHVADLEATHKFARCASDPPTHVSLASALAARWSGRKPPVPDLAATLMEKLSEGPLSLEAKRIVQKFLVESMQYGIEGSPASCVEQEAFVFGIVCSMRLRGFATVLRMMFERASP